ncbi:MAG TPA: aminotransferase class IV [Euzebyales bacterium]|nr:aminotransferase class IV [Euzebyales bacterium]
MVTQIALVDGVAAPLDQAALPITDAGVARGDGGFETIGVWDGRPFRVADHLQRLDRTLAAIGLPPAPVDPIRGDLAQVLQDQTGDGALRIFVTGSGTRIVALADPPARATLDHLVCQPAPWIRPLGTYGPAAAKTMSYGPNMAASRAAQRAGGDDALLISLEGLVLEGPTFTVMWMRDGELVAPALDLGLVDSISRRSILEVAVAAGVTCRTGDYTRDDVLAADEVLTCSAVRPVHALTRLDDHDLPRQAPVTTRLAAALDRWRRGTTAAP